MSHPYKAADAMDHDEVCAEIGRARASGQEYRAHILEMRLEARAHQPMTEAETMREDEKERERYEEQLAEAGSAYATEGFDGAEAMELARRWIGPPPYQAPRAKPEHQPFDDDLNF